MISGSKSKGIKHFTCIYWLPCTLPDCPEQLWPSTPGNVLTRHYTSLHTQSSSLSHDRDLRLASEQICPHSRSLCRRTMWPKSLRISQSPYVTLQDFRAWSKTSCTLQEALPLWNRLKSLCVNHLTLRRLWSSFLSQMCQHSCT